jgi:hypothetical protein
VRSGLLGLAVLALLGFTLHSLRLSDASFAAASANTSNVFIAGSLGHVDNQDGRVMISVSDMEPGSSADAIMTLTGTGNVPGDYTLTAASVVNTPSTAPLAGELVLAVEDIAGATTLWDDTVSDLLTTTDPPELGIIAPDQTRSYRVTVSYPDGPNEGALQGASMTLVLQVTGVSQ